MLLEKIYHFVAGKNMYNGKISENGNYLETSDSETIAKAIKYISDSRKDITNIVIDTVPSTRMCGNFLCLGHVVRCKQNSGAFL